MGDSDAELSWQPVKFQLKEGFETQAKELSDKNY